jgi:uncharacterized protein
MSQEDEKEMFVAGLVLDPSTNSPIVILKDSGGEICLPIWIGVAEASAIASVLKGVAMARPMTHDLLRNVIAEMGGRLNRITIAALQDNTFFASLEIIVGDYVRVIDSRPSDAIALALRVGAPILVHAKVLNQAQVTLVPGSQTGEGEGEEGTPVEVEEILPIEESTNFASIEKEKWADLLAEMDPDDFKYKM